MLFNIFINDMMEDQEEISGVEVPAGRQSRGLKSAFTVAGALFADDAVGLSPTVEKVVEFCDRISEWCDINEMQVGIKKCGIMEFLPDPDDPPFLTEEHLRKMIDDHLLKEEEMGDRVKVARVVQKIVDTGLGLPDTPWHDWDEWVKGLE